MEQKIKDRLARLVSKGDRLMDTVEEGGMGHRWVDELLYQEWRVQVLNLLERTVGVDAVYFKQAAKVQDRNELANATALLGIVRGFQEDVADGGLRRLEDIASAEVFSDLLEQAGHLLGGGYIGPSAGLIGAVLERELRALCIRHGIKFKRGDGLAALNSKLASAQAYSSIRAKKVELWTKIRNDADHGHFESLEKDDVKGMLDGVTRFIDECSIP